MTEEMNGMFIATIILLDMYLEYGASGPPSLPPSPPNPGRHKEAEV